MYAKAPDGVSLAYQVTGDGPLDLFFVSGLLIPFDLVREEPSFLRFARRLATFSRTMFCDSRGVGASGGDFVDSFAWETSDADIDAVLDAADFEQTVLVGTGIGGPSVIHYAATRPERVSALVLINTYAHYVIEDNYPWGLSLDIVDRIDTPMNEMWGTATERRGLEYIAPSKAGDKAFRAWWAQCQRMGLPPEQAAESLRGSFMQDVRQLLPTLVVPTLVLHREGNRYMEVGAGRHLGDNVPGAKYVELRGADQLFFLGDTDALLDEVEEFLTGTHQAPEGDVVTATILFTDIVSSTEQAARLGHRRWTALTDDHDAIVRTTLARYRGREVKTIGDGFLATFDATTRAVRAATEIVAAAKGIGLDVRAGLHNGDVEVRPDDVVGLAVTISKRICDLAGPGEVLVSDAVKSHLVGSGMASSDRGTHTLKGVPDEWNLFAVGY